MQLQGYVDPDEAPMKKIGSIFGWKNKKVEEPEAAAPKSKKMSGKKPAPKKGGVTAAKAGKVAEVKPKKKGWW